MKPAIAVVALACTLLFGAGALAQRHYSFEEACRNAGQTTGACAPQAKQVQPMGCLKLEGHAFHPEKTAGDCVQTTLSPVLDAEILVELIGLENVDKINQLKLTIGRSAGINNAIAGFHNGSRMIIHDPQWAKAATAESYLVLGHEIGHHFCGHTLKTFEGRPQEKELEADRFSGASLKRFEIYHRRAFLADGLKAAARLYSDEGSRSHPPRAARIEAIRLGYNSGSPCGSLAPGIPGYSPQPR